VPYLQNTIAFALSPTAVDDILKYKPKGYPKKRKDIEKLLTKLPDMTIEFDFDQLDGSTESQNAPLEPGYAFFLEAMVTFEPVYKQGIWGPLFSYPKIVDWNFRIDSTSVTKTELDWFSRQQAEVRYVVKISDSAKQVIVAYETDMKTFIDSLGSSAGIVAAGVFILSFIHFVTCQVREQRKKKAEEEQDRIAKAVLVKVIKSMRSERKRKMSRSSDNSPVFFADDTPLKSAPVKRSFPVPLLDEQKMKEKFEIPNLGQTQEGQPSPRAHHAEEDQATVSPIHQRFFPSFRGAKVAPAQAATTPTATITEKDIDIPKDADLV